MLRAELAFYLGCTEPARHASRARASRCAFPTRARRQPRRLSARGLYDVVPGPAIDSRAVGNDVDADGKRLVMITGANQGGKSTFLRSVGAGPADDAKRNVRPPPILPRQRLRRRVHPLQARGRRHHDQREAGRGAGRMSEIADGSRPERLLLCNESFASTNEREGSEIARQVVPRADRVRGQGALRHPPLRPGARLLPRARRHARCSCAPSGGPTGGAPSGWWKASRLPTSYGAGLLPARLRRVLAPWPGRQPRMSLPRARRWCAASGRGIQVDEVSPAPDNYTACASNTHRCYGPTHFPSRCCTVVEPVGVGA